MVNERFQHLVFVRSKVAPLFLTQQIGWFGGESVRNSHHDKQARIPRTAFNPAKVGQVDFGIECQLFLREFTRLPQSPDISPHDSPPVLHSGIGR